MGQIFGPPGSIGIVSHGIFGSPKVSASGWIAQVSPTVAAWAGSATDGAGNTLAVDVNNNVWRSSDGGVTWSARTGIVDAQPVSSIAFGAGVFIATGSGVGSPVHRSTDEGVTWVSHATGALTSPLTALSMIATNGSGMWIVGCNGGTAPSAVKNYAVSTDNGLTWTPGPIGGYDNDGWALAHSAIWDGSEFVVGGIQFNTGASTIVTTPDGVTWTETASTSSFDRVLTQAFGLYIIGGSSNNVFVASTPAGLATAASTPIAGLDPGGIADVLFDGTLLFAFDFVGGVARSLTALAWVLDNPLNLASGDFPLGTCVYDAVNTRNIALGANAGSIANRSP